MIQRSNLVLSVLFKDLRREDINHSRNAAYRGVRARSVFLRVRQPNVVGHAVIVIARPGVPLKKCLACSVFFAVAFMRVKYNPRLSCFCLCNLKPRSP